MAGEAGLIRAVLLDRDGVLNVDNNYVCSADRFAWIEGAPDAIRWLNDHGVLAIVVTNQSGIARGIFTYPEYEAFMDWVKLNLAEHGAHFDRVYVCPHHATEGIGEYAIDCDCRKPRPGMVRAALRDFDLRPEEVILIGDRERDLTAGATAGVRGFLFEGGNLLTFVKAIFENAETISGGVV